MKPALTNICRNHLRGVCLYKINEKACLKFSVETGVICTYTYEICMYHTDCSIIETHFYMLYTHIYTHTTVYFCILFLYSTYSSKHYMFHSSSRLEVNEQAFSHICTEQIIFFTVHDKLKEHLSDRPICQSTTKC